MRAKESKGNRKSEREIGTDREIRFVLSMNKIRFGFRKLSRFGWNGNLGFNETHSK